jgi:hypothetical protein
MPSKGRKLADMMNGTEGKAVGYDENGELSELETDVYSEDDYIVDELVDYQWNS